MFRLVVCIGAVLLSSPAAAQCYAWVPTGAHDLTTTSLPVAASGSPRPFLVRLRGAHLPRYDGGCDRETLFAQLAKAKILLETSQAMDLRFCAPERDGDDIVATVLVNGRDLVGILAEKGFAQTGAAPRGWCSTGPAGRE